MLHLCESNFVFDPTVYCIKVILRNLFCIFCRMKHNICPLCFVDWQSKFVFDRLKPFHQISQNIVSCSKVEFCHEVVDIIIVIWLTVRAGDCRMSLTTLIEQLFM